MLLLMLVLLINDSVSVPMVPLQLEFIPLNKKTSHKGLDDNNL